MYNLAKKEIVLRNSLKKRKHNIFIKNIFQ